MAIELSGLTVFLTGRVPGRDRYTLERAIRDGGGKVAGKLTKSVGVVVMGNGPAKAVVAKNTELGLQTIDGEQLLTLLRDGRLDLTGGTDGSEDFDDVIGELRSALAQTPSPEAWNRIVAAIDACADDELEQAVEYARGQLARWPIHARKARWASMTQWEHSEGGRYIDGDMRVAPTHWVAQMLEGDYSLKHSLASALTLHGHKTNATQAKKVFANPYLADSLRALDMGRMNKFTKGLFKAIAQSPNLGALESLNYFPRVPGAGALLAGQTSMPNLKTLRIRGIVYTDYDKTTGDLEGLFEASWLDRIVTFESSTTITTGWTGGVAAFEYLEAHSDRFTNLRHIVATDGISQRMGMSCLDRIETLTLHSSHPRSFDHSLPAIAARGLPALEELDLSQVFTVPMRASTREWADSLWKHRGDLERLGVPVYLGPDAPARARQAAPP